MSNEISLFIEAKIDKGLSHWPMTSYFYVLPVIVEMNKEVEEEREPKSFPCMCLGGQREVIEIRRSNGVGGGWLGGGTGGGKDVFVKENNGGTYDDYFIANPDHVGK
jgi:hypothetical protein